MTDRLLTLSDAIVTAIADLAADGFSSGLWQDESQGPSGSESASESPSASDWQDAAGDVSTIMVKRTYLPIVVLPKEKIGATFVSVVPIDDELARIASGTYQGEFNVKTFVQEKLGPFVSEDADAEKLDALVGFCGAIEDVLLDSPLSVLSKSAWCIKAGRKPAFDMELLGNDREFLASIDTAWKIIGC